MVDFKTWLGAYPYNVRHSASMSDYILNRSNQPRVNFVGRYEKYEEDFEFVCDKLEISNTGLQLINNTEHRNYTEYYDDETRQVVEQLCSRDIEVFNYEFGN